MPRPATYEFSSFRAENDHTRSAPRPSSTPREGPWLPPGGNKAHLRTRGLPSAAQREAAAVAAAHSEAAAEREEVSAHLSSAESGFARLEDTLESFVHDYEQHVIAASAAAVLVQTKLRELGVEM